MSADFSGKTSKPRAFINTGRNPCDIPLAGGTMGGLSYTLSPTRPPSQPVHKRVCWGSPEFMMEISLRFLRELVKPLARCCEEGSECLETVCQ
ncbi:hypothetical protein BaRGS_00005902 [Batillaria attramentaria]|uniref:Uncharacterized protein n=1 Tax=Batillaria attramentaria TaxID=370345 RepID=A0ABD0LV12_9CAEN